MLILGRPSSLATSVKISFASALVIALMGVVVSPRTALGDANEAPSNSLNLPVQSSIALGWLHSCVIVSDQTVRCWGGDSYGALGNGSATTSDQDTPVTVSNLTGVKALTAGYYTSCALLAAGTVKCWGWNNNGQLGDGTASSPPTENWNKDAPVDVAGVGGTGILTGVTAIASGVYHTCALLSDKTVVCWGYIVNGQLGQILRAYVPEAVNGLTDVTAIAAGYEHTCALLVDKTVKCWGANGNGELGRGHSQNTQAVKAALLIPEAVSGLTDVVALSLGRHHSCALLVDKTVRCWGFNAFGQVGDGTNDGKTSPVPVTGLSDVTAISAGDYHTCAVLEDKTAKCWGRNNKGQLGNGEIDDENVPVTINGLSGVTAITAGLQHTCAVLSSSVLCWGDNSQKQLGIGPNGGSEITIPTPVIPANGDSITPVQPLDPPTQEPDNNSSNGNTPNNPGGNTTNNNSNDTLQLGEYNATVNGQSIDIDITTSTDGQVNIEGPDFSLTFDSPTSGDKNELFLPQGGNITFKGKGYKPNSQITSTLADKEISSAKVLRNGSFTSKMSVPRSTKSGNHRLSINGTTAKGATRAIVIGVKVAKLKKTTVRTFRVYSTKMRPKLRRQSKRIVKQNPTLTAVHCEGFVRPSKATNPKDIARATKRAKSVCRYLKKKKKSMHTTFSVSPSTQNRRRVEVSYR